MTATACLARSVETDRDVETLRQIRNACRQFLTGDTSHIDEERQRRWWASRDPHTLPIWLFSVDGVDVGYSLLRWDADDKGWCITVAILSEWRGKGLGTAMHRFLLAQKPGEPLISKQLKTNVAAFKSAQAGGFIYRYSEGDWNILTATGGTICVIPENQTRPNGHHLDARTFPAGRALDAFIAEEVMGWDSLSDHEGLVVAENGHLLGRPPGQAYLADVPEFSTSSGAALQVLTRIPSLGFVGFSLHDWPSDGVDERWCASFGKHESFGDKFAEAVAPTAPLAICRAALLAVRR